MGRWQDIGTCPKIEDREVLGIWIDIDGKENIVIVRYSASNDLPGRGVNHGFIGRHGQLYGAGGVTKWMDLPLTPSQEGGF